MALKKNKLPESFNISIYKCFVYKITFVTFTIHTHKFKRLPILYSKHIYFRHGFGLTN